MALSPETQDALAKALDAVIAECGDDPQYAALVENLEQARDAMPEGDAADAPEGGEDEGGEKPNPFAGEKEDTSGDAFDFDKATEKFKARRKAAAEDEAPEGDE